MRMMRERDVTIAPVFDIVHMTIPTQSILEEMASMAKKKIVDS
jgi:hypothetical protein